MKLRCSGVGTFCCHAKLEPSDALPHREDGVYSEERSGAAVRCAVAACGNGAGLHWAGARADQDWCGRASVADGGRS